MDDEGGDNITIRTMKDDLTGAVAKLPAPALPLPAEALAKAGPAPKTLPLPPRPEAAGPVVPEPLGGGQNITRRNRRRLLSWLGIGLGATAALAGGVWAFVTFFSASPAGKSPSPEPSPALSVPVPGSASLAIHYSVSDPNDRGQLLQLWQNSSKTLLQGNPKQLLTSANINQFMYVMLTGDSRPYLLIPKAEVEEPLISQLSQNQVVEYSGLYVLHALNATAYLDALGQTTTVDSLIEKLDDVTPPGRPLNIFLGESAINQIRREAAGEPFAAGGVTGVLLSAELSPDKTALVLDGAGQQSPRIPSPVVSPGLATPPADQGLLDAVPGDSTLVRLGANLAQDWKTWEGNTRVLDQAVLQPSAVAALINQLNASYAFYRRTGADGMEDVGLITSLPKEMNPPLAMGDATLEAALPALIPLILPTKPATVPAFSDATYQEIPLRFVNFTGTDKALDYTIHGSKLLVASSKEGMFETVHVAVQKSTAASSTPPWKNLLSAAGALPASPKLILGYVSYQPLVGLLPTTEARLPGIISEEATPTGIHISGALTLIPPL